MDANNFGHKSFAKKHPQENSNIISDLFYCWLIPIFRTGLKKELSEEDLFANLNRHDCNKLVDKLEKVWNELLEKNVKPSLWKAIWKVFKWEIIWNMAIFLVLELVIRIARPIALGALLGYYISNQTNTSKTDTIIYAGIIMVASFLDSIIGHAWFIHAQQIALKCRVAISSLIYRKSLKLSKAALSATTLGHIVNLLSNDAQKITDFWIFFHAMYASPIQAFLILYLLYLFSGPTALVGVISIIVSIPLQVFMVKRAANYRLQIALKTDERIKHMSEIISGIQVIKVYTWELPFSKLIDSIRKKEIYLIKIVGYLEALNRSFFFFTDRTAIFLCVLTYVFTGHPPDAQYVFVVSSFYYLLMEAVSVSFSVAVSIVFQANVSIKRLENFLYSEEKHSEIRITNQTVIKIEEASAKWSKNSTNNTLSKINFEALKGEVVAVVGPIGGGKSSLLQLCLGEISLTEGSVTIGGSISYANQEPWLFAGSIKKNILFGLPMNVEKYRKILKVCALEDDILQFPYGDRTIVGERGILLSGGQKARINLARAIYRDADIYLLDDPLSAVDVSVGKKIFKNCISDYLAGKIVVLVTHQIQYLSYVDRIYLMSNGVIETYGSYNELKTSGKDFTKLLSQSESCDYEETKSLEEKEVKNESEEQEDEEIITKGKVSSKVYTTYFRSGGSYFNMFLISFLFITLEIFSTGSDYYITFWVNLEQERMEKNLSTNFVENSFSDREKWIYIYAAIMVGLIVLAVVSVLSLIRTCMMASIHLHNNMFTSIINATMKFFYTNSSGRILNRFAKDIDIIDEHLPTLLNDVIEVTLASIATVLAICLVSPWSFIPTLVITVAMYFIRMVYLATSRPIKRMESRNRSPIFAHFSESVKGLTTIRACGASEILEKEFNNLQNVHSTLYYTFLTTNRAFGVCLDLTCVFYVMIITIIALTQETYGGNIGFVITQGMSLTGLFQWCIRRWSDLENQMISMERILEYIIKVEGENDKTVKEAPSHWPKLGKLEFKSVYMQYSPKDPHVLENLNLVIKPKEKIGIVGRTGAGKSSLISVLFRLVDFQGQVIIDGVDTKRISLSSLRSKISIIPQDPVLFSSSVRKNLDPFDQYSDDQIWKVLEEVKLKDFIIQLPEALQSGLAEGGANFSAGQKQLICLARALLKNNRILVLDEATANVDPHTDELLQETIRKNFAECTVLTIAHRLHTIMDSDKVLVMENGQIVEFDHPFTLLENRGIFYDLVVETGNKMSENLIEIARKNL